MIQKTEGIVLRVVRHQDANVITTIFTREYGLRTFIIKGFRSPRARRKHSYFQPLSVVELVLFYNENRAIHSISESRLAYPLMEAQTDPVKLSLGLTALEVFLSSVKEEEENEPMYAFLRSFIVGLETNQVKLVNLFIHFLVHLTIFLGFFPQDESDESPKVRFDLENGLLIAGEADDQAAEVLRQFLYVSQEGSLDLVFSNEVKREIIRRMLEYYRRHVEGFRYPNAMGVFGELYN